MCWGGRETGICPERYPSGGVDADGVLSKKVRDASVDEEAGVINVGGDAAGGRAAIDFNFVQLLDCNSG